MCWSGLTTQQWSLSSMCLIPLFRRVQQIFSALARNQTFFNLRAVYSPGHATFNWRSCQGKGGGPGNGGSCKWLSPYDRGTAERKWTCLSLRSQPTVPSGSPLHLQLHWGWMGWYRCDRGFVCTPYLQ